MGEDFQYLTQIKHFKNFHNLILFKFDTNGNVLDLIHMFEKLKITI